MTNIIVLCLKCLFSRLKKYSFRSHCTIELCTLKLRLGYAIRLSAFLIRSCEIQVALLSSFSEFSWQKSLPILYLCKAIRSSSSSSLCTMLCFMTTAKLRGFSCTLSGLSMSQRPRAGFLDSSFLYSYFVCLMVRFIKLM